MHYKPSSHLKAPMVYALRPDAATILQFVEWHALCRFECRSDGSYIEIQHVSLEKTGQEAEDSEYTGPVSWLLAVIERLSHTNRHKHSMSTA
jgi:hypothetical protein